MEILTTTPERRQIAKRLRFTGHLAEHVRWDSIYAQAAALGANVESRRDAAGDTVITLFWVLDADEIADADAFGK